MVSSTQAIMAVITTVRLTNAPEIRSSVEPLAAVGAGAIREVEDVDVEIDRVAEVNVDNLLDKLEMALDCEAEMLEIADDALETADDASALIDEAAELAPEASEEVTDAKDDAAEVAPEARDSVALETAAEVEAVLIGTTTMADDPETTVVRVIEPVVAALKEDTASLLRELAALLRELTPDTRPGTMVSLDCEDCSEANAELKTVKALVVPTVGAIVEAGVDASMMVRVLEVMPEFAEDPPTTAALVAELVLVRDSRAELRTVRALMVPVLVAVGVDSTGVTVVTGIITLTPVVEAALGDTDDAAAPEEDSVTVTVTTIDGWPVQTGRVTLVIWPRGCQ